MPYILISAPIPPLLICFSLMKVFTRSTAHLSSLVGAGTLIGMSWISISRNNRENKNQNIMIIVMGNYSKDIIINLLQF